MSVRMLKSWEEYYLLWECYECQKRAVEGNTIVLVMFLLVIVNLIFIGILNIYSYLSKCMFYSDPVYLYYYPPP